MGSLPISNGKVVGDTLTYEVDLEGAKITHEAKLNAAGRRDRGQGDRRLGRQSSTW